jgi:1-acyl-sn-glycerol-3-phosphate acyltransferase
MSLLKMLGAELQVGGWPVGGLPGNVLIVANHISWLDIFVLNAVQPSRFVAKADLASWPMVGRLIADCGTLFIERGRGRDAHRINRDARAALEAGDVIAVFPEGKTSDGSELLPFHGSLLQPVIDARGQVQPMAIRYRDSNGARAGSVAYDGDTTFMTSLWRVLAQQRIVIRLDLAPPLAAHGRHRRDLAREAEDAIRKLLATTAIFPAPGTAAGRPA